MHIWSMFGWSPCVYRILCNKNIKYVNFSTFLFHSHINNKQHSITVIRGPTIHTICKTDIKWYHWKYSLLARLILMDTFANCVVHILTNNNIIIIYERVLRDFKVERGRTFPNTSGRIIMRAMAWTVVASIITQPIYWYTTWSKTKIQIYSK